MIFTKKKKKKKKLDTRSINSTVATYCYYEDGILNYNKYMVKTKEQATDRLIYLFILSSNKRLIFFIFLFCEKQEIG